MINKGSLSLPNRTKIAIEFSKCWQRNKDKNIKDNNKEDSDNKENDNEHYDNEDNDNWSMSGSDMLSALGLV